MELAAVGGRRGRPVGAAPVALPRWAVVVGQAGVITRMIIGCAARVRDAGRRGELRWRGAGRADADGSGGRGGDAARNGDAAGRGRGRGGTGGGVPRVLGQSTRDWLHRVSSCEGRIAGETGWMD
jgi:hypothetical protein